MLVGGAFWTLLVLTNKLNIDYEGKHLRKKFWLVLSGASKLLAYLQKFVPSTLWKRSICDKRYPL